MLAKTHAAIGTAAAITILQPKTLPEMIFGIGIAAIGSIISDIDNENTTAKRLFQKVMIFITGISVLLLTIYIVFKPQIFIIVFSNNNIERKLMSLGLISLICMTGSMSRHRTFMHSFLTGGLIYYHIYYIIPNMAMYFFIGFLSHLCLDIMNYKGVQLFWPLNKTFKLNWCKSDGYANFLLMIAGIVLLVIRITLFFVFKII